MTTTVEIYKDVVLKINKEVNYIEIGSGKKKRIENFVVDIYVKDKKVDRDFCDQDTIEDVVKYKKQYWSRNYYIERYKKTMKRNEADKLLTKINVKEIKNKFPLLHKNLMVMGYDNNMVLNKTAVIKVNLKQLKDTETFFRHLKGKKNRQVIKDKKTLESIDKSELNISASKTFVIGEETYKNALVKSHPKGKIANKVIGKFFSGSYEIFTY